MKVETNPFFYLEEDEVVFVQDGDVEEVAGKILVTGMMNDEEIYIIKNLQLLEWIATLTHEMGHFVGDRISFRDGSVLRPNEISEQFIELTDAELTLLKRELTDTEEAESISHTKEEIDILVGICFRLISVFLKDADAGLDEVKLHLCEPEDIVEILRDPEFGTVRADGKVVGKNDKQGRNEELPSIFVEIACMMILENSLKRDGIIDWDDDIEVHLKSFPHQRAQNIIVRGFQYNYAIPSMVDLESMEDSSKEVEA